MVPFQTLFMKYLIFQNQDINWTVLKDYHVSVIRAIRTYDRSNIILCSCPDWDYEIDQVMASPIAEPDNINIMYTIHLNEGIVDWIGPMYEQAIDQHLPIWVSEASGMGEESGVFERAEWDDWIWFFQKFNISWVATYLSPRGDDNILAWHTFSEEVWDEHSYTPWGKEVRRILSQENGLEFDANYVGPSGSSSSESISGWGIGLIIIGVAILILAVVAVYLTFFKKQPEGGGSGGFQQIKD